MIPLTFKQTEVLVFIDAFTKKKGFPPSIREIGEFFKLSPPSVLNHLRALEKKGFIRREPLKPRCLEILKRPGELAA